MFWALKTVLTTGLWTDNWYKNYFRAHIPPSHHDHGAMNMPLCA